MRSSDRQIAAARKIDQDPLKGRDTVPAPPPSSASSADDTDQHDTIPTPAPESGITDVVVIPPLRNVNVDDRA
jgi:hypothetical protein